VVKQQVIINVQDLTVTVGDLRPCRCSMSFIRDLRDLTNVATWFGKTCLKGKNIRILCACKSYDLLIPPLQESFNTLLSAAMIARLEEINDKVVKASEAKVVIFLNPLWSVMEIEDELCQYAKSWLLVWYEINVTYQSCSISDCSRCDLPIHTKKSCNIRFRCLLLRRSFLLLSTWSFFRFLLVKRLRGRRRCEKSTKGLSYC